MDIFNVKKFVYFIRKGEGQRTWDYSIVRPRDDDRDLYMVHGYFYVEIE